MEGEEGKVEKEGGEAVFPVEIPAAVELVFSVLHTHTNNSLFMKHDMHV